MSSSIAWSDERRPQPRRVDGPAAPVAEALRKRMGAAAAATGLAGELPASTTLGRGAAYVPGGGGRRGAVDLEGFDDGSAHTTPAAPGRERQVRPGDARRSGRARRGVEANARLTGATAAVIFVLLGIEGLTVLFIRPLLSVHVFVGMLLVPLVLLKIGSTTWRFAKYYLGDREYRRRGPPAPLLRLIGPVLIVLTLVLLGSGIALLLAPLSMRGGLLLVHQASFVLWLIVIGVHVLGHLLDTARLAPRDWYWRTRRQVEGAGVRQWAVASSVVIGLIAGAVTLPALGSWLLAGAR